MIEVTKINGVKMLVNTSLIETVEETPVVEEVAEEVVEATETAKEEN